MLKKELTLKLKEAITSNCCLLSVSTKNLNEYFALNFPSNEIHRCLCHIFDDFVEKNNVEPDYEIYLSTSKKTTLDEALTLAEETDRYFISLTTIDANKKNIYNHYWSHNRIEKQQVVQYLNELIDKAVKEEIKKGQWK